VGGDVVEVRWVEHRNVDLGPLLKPEMGTGGGLGTVNWLKGRLFGGVVGLFARRTVWGKGKHFEGPRWNGGVNLTFKRVAWGGRSAKDSGST